MRILVVEDSQVVSRVMRHLITQELDCVVDVAPDMASAKKLLLENDYFVAVTDLNLPDAQDGEIVKLVLAQQLPCIVLTGSWNPQERSRLLQLGIVDYVLKENRFSYEYTAKLVKRLQRNQSVKVLVADDSLVSRKFIRSLLEQHLFQVIEADDGLAALDILKGNADIKLLITDYNMPRLDGFGLIIKVREQFSREDMAIIGLSSDSDESLSARFIKNGANDFLQKPFVHEEFHCRVLNTLDALDMMAKLWEQANLDYLTNVFNRRYFFSLYEDKLPVIVRNQRMLSLGLMDIDFFKKVNDTYGHDVGDEVLIEFAARLKQSFSQHFTVARFGGEEFVIGFKGLSVEKTFALLDRFRMQLESKPVTTSKGDLTITVSTGVASFIVGESVDDMLQRADVALYEAKSSGRNLVCIA
ncbi:diguanylate cyclase response regulator [Shewanella sp. Choline-02u-19]|uniref:GGDEF domain-containing response regulator n=1 Tax=unclassified Shewanella TaxID=196818 RepID=UPI000C324A1F|nr:MULTISPECIES: response regulator [unclassified Shewanella]PKG57818.1 diguanylate cyclase response regulator [Shewanella sp. GutDb-MelDb]PKG74195.1 diguanylate cyclase response regulator [Shewanella sp. GutCb]PKH55856.1 diguanylate cyclase response regulator [Shewanella sp. Bg11-22]PKI27220.1 diguanylate cyclase response regulator [Shewanella sp. Choline-02u-19]